jgi:hypothetical protein
VFRAEAKGKPLVLENAGVVAGNEVFKDRETGSRWQQSSLEAISGPLQGQHLQLYPFVLTSWDEWLRLHPQTLVLKPLPGYADRIAQKNAQIAQGLSGVGNAPDDVTYHDDRLKPKAMVFGLNVTGAVRAYPLESLRRVRLVNDTLGGAPVVIVHQPKSDTTTAFVARAGKRPVTFDASNPETTELTDRETHSRWNAYGECVAGPLKGTRLEMLVLEPEYWFAWSEFHRETSIYQP